VGEAHLGISHALDLGVEQLEVGAIAESELIEAFGLGARDVAGRGPAGRVRVLMMRNERAPVLVPGALDRFADLLAGKRRGYQTLGVKRKRSVRSSKRPAPTSVQLTEPANEVASQYIIRTADPAVSNAYSTMGPPCPGLPEALA
jgi:hypothetical protein